MAADDDSEPLDDTRAAHPLNTTREDPPADRGATDQKPAGEPVAAAADHDQAPEPVPGRGRFRPWLLLALLIALIGLLAQRPDLREPALASSRSALMDALNISPRAIYAFRLRIAGLHDSALGRRWREAVARAGESPVETGRRYATTAGFSPDVVEAHIYQTRLDRGERLEIRLTRRDTPTDERSRLYASLERRAADADGEQGWSTVATLATDGSLESRLAERAGDYRVVLQPELAARAAYRLAIAHGGSLSFPVRDAAEHDIGSGFGAPRDGGSRKHHGLDIFADRGTPVTAVADGNVRTGSGGIGGKHVWLSSGMLGIGRARYYYAHLDEIAVESGARVQAGEVVGYVGNTGNARTTPPHLHFGIYTGFGPVDPAPFLRPAPRLPSE